MPDALFERIGDDRYLPTDASRGPWSPDSLHGGPVGALMAGAVEPLLENLHPARVSLELLRPVPMAPLAVATTVSRPGKKVRMVDGSLSSEDGTVVATVRVLGIRQEAVDLPDGAVPDRAAPPSLPADPSGRWDLSSAVTYDAFHNVGVEHRFVAGLFGEPGPATDWIRLRVPVVAGEAVTPLQRVMAAADFGNGISAVSDFTTMLFINPDLTVHLHRLPVGEWVCLDAETALAGNGVGLAQSELWDERGLLGRALQSLLVGAR